MSYSPYQLWFYLELAQILQVKGSVPYDAPLHPCHPPQSPATTERVLSYPIIHPPHCEFGVPPTHSRFHNSLERFTELSKVLYLGLQLIVKDINKQADKERHGMSARGCWVRGPLSLQSRVCCRPHTSCSPNLIVEECLSRLHCLVMIDDVISGWWLNSISSSSLLPTKQGIELKVLICNQVWPSPYLETT